MTTPFIIYALPRSRTAWLANFLSYKEYKCHHEQAIFMRNMDNVKEFFSRPFIGSSETAAAPGRKLILSVVPNMKEVVILRPVNEVVDSMMNVDVGGVASYDREKLQKGMEYGDRILRKIAKDPNVLTISYADLDKQETCAAIFEHCLPYKFDKSWWESLKDKNIQADAKAVLGYYFKNRAPIEAFKKYCKSELRRLMRAGQISTYRMA